MIQKTWNNTVYNIPQSGERGWATLTNFLTALADGAQTTGKQLIGRRTVTVTPVTVTPTTDCYVGVDIAADVGVVNLPAGVNGQVFIISDESGAASTYNITINPSGANTIDGAASFVLDQDKQTVYLVFSGGDWVIIHNGSSVAPIFSVTDSTTIDFTLTAGNLTAIIKDDSITNAKINSSAAIAYAKLNLAASIVDADIATAAGIVYSKLNLTGCVVNADINASAAIAYSKLDLATSIVNADVNASAAIARTKLGLGTADHVIINDGTGAFSSEAQLAKTRGGTGVSSTATFPTSGVVVTEAATETLTNKTLTTPIIAAINTGTTTFTLMTSAGTNGQVIQTDASNNLTFVDPPSAPAATFAANDSNVTFVSADNKYQAGCLPTAARTYTMPATLVAGVPWVFYNLASADGLAITIQTSGSNTITKVPPLGYVTIMPRTTTPTTAANWYVKERASQWVSYVPSITRVGTATSNVAYYKIQGDSLFIKGFFVAGATTSGIGSIDTPTQFPLVAAKLPTNNTNTNAGPIIGSFGNSSTQSSGPIVSATGTSTTAVYFGRPWSAGSNSITPASGATFTTGESISYEFEVPSI